MKEESRKLLDKANRAFQAAETLLRAGDSESAAGRCYYAMLHAAQALLRDLDVRFRRHGAVHAAYGEHFAKTALLDPKYHRWLLDAFDERLRSDYDIDVTFNPEAIRRRIEQAREFLDAARKYLEASP